MERMGGEKEVRRGERRARRRGGRRGRSEERGEEVTRCIQYIMYASLV